MPIYEYECVKCNHRFELKQGFDADPTEPCPLCQSLSRRKFHAPTVIYKGSGFYTTDYARKNQPSDNGSSSDGGTSSTKTSEAAKETPKEKETSSKDD